MQQSFNASIQIEWNELLRAALVANCFLKKEYQNGAFIFKAKYIPISETDNATYTACGWPGEFERRPLIGCY